MCHWTIICMLHRTLLLSTMRIRGWAPTIFTHDDTPTLSRLVKPLPGDLSRIYKQDFLSAIFNKWSIQFDFSSRHRVLGFNPSRAGKAYAWLQNVQRDGISSAAYLTLYSIDKIRVGMKPWHSFLNQCNKYINYIIKYHLNRQLNEHTQQNKFRKSHNPLQLL